MESEFARYQRPRTEKEAAIVRAAELVFAEAGFDAATTAQLAKRAGVTERTLFKYFPTKPDLYRRVLAGLLYATILPGHMSDLKQRITATGPNFQDWYISILTARYHAVAAEPFRLRLLWGALLYSPDFADLFGTLWRKNLYEPSVEAIKHYQSISQVRSDISADAIVRSSFSLAAGFLLAQFVFAPGSHEFSEQALQEIADIFSRGISLHALPDS